MSMFDKIKKALSGGAEKPEQPAAEASRQDEDSTIERNRERAAASGREIISAVDALLFSMRSAHRFPSLTEEDVASLAERFGNLQKFIGGTHCDNDVSELDANILAFVQCLEGQMADAPREGWDELLKRLNGAVKARIASEFEIRAAALDMAEALLINTNAAWEKQVAQLEEAVKGTSDMVQQMRLQEQAFGTRKNILVNRQRLEEIAALRLQLQESRIGPSPEAIRQIEAQLSEIRTATPEFLRIAQENEEALRKKTIENKVMVEQMKEMNQKLQDALDAANAQSLPQGEKLSAAAQSIAEQTAARREADQIAD